MAKKTPAAEEAATEQPTVNSDPMAANPSADHALAEQDTDASAGEALSTAIDAVVDEDQAADDKDVQDQPAAEPVKLVAMIRDEPIHEDGPSEADVHPDEVENWLPYGWRVKGDVED